GRRSVVHAAWRLVRIDLALGRGDHDGERHRAVAGRRARAAARGEHQADRQEAEGAHGRLVLGQGWQARPAHEPIVAQLSHTVPAIRPFPGSAYPRRIRASVALGRLETGRVSSRRARLASATLAAMSNPIRYVPEGY